MNGFSSILDLAISGTAFVAIPEAVSLLFLSVGLIALAGISRWILSKFDVVDKTFENEAK